MLQGEAEDGFQLALVFHRCAVFTPSGTGTEAMGTLKHKQVKQEKNPTGDLPEPPQQDKVSDQNLCLVSLSTKSSHELNYFQNKPTAAGASWGFHASQGKRRNKIPKATAASSCRSGHMGTVWSSSSPEASLVSGNGFLSAAAASKPLFLRRKK